MGITNRKLIYTVRILPTRQCIFYFVLLIQNITTKATYKRKHLIGGLLTFQRFGPLSSWQGAWHYAVRHCSSRWDLPWSVGRDNNNGFNVETSKLTLSNTLPPARPHLLRVPITFLNNASTQGPSVQISSLSGRFCNLQLWILSNMVYLCLLGKLGDTFFFQRLWVLCVSIESPMKLKILRL